MGTVQQSCPTGTTRRHLAEAVIAYLAFCGLSILSRYVMPAFLLVVVSGIAFPLAWAKLTRDWTAIGFTRRKLGQALLWGLGAGLAGMLYVFLGARGDALPTPPMLGLQLAFGIPTAMLIVSPFQEFFFRGWLQPRLEAALGKWAGLLVTSLSFALWHLFPPFEGSATSTISVTSPGGILTTIGMGLAFGYIFQRTRNIVAPWLAHALMIVATISVGAMTLIQLNP